jgi:hypothetical protein
MALAAVCSGLLAGCGGSGKAAAGKSTGAAAASGSASSTTIAVVSGTQKPACGLITQAEIEAAIGAKVGAGHETVDATHSVCSFSLAASADQSVILISTTSSGSAAAFASARGQLGSAAQPLNVGDQAFVAGAQAAVLRGTTLVAVLVIVRQPTAGPAAAATKVAQAVAARL